MLVPFVRQQTVQGGFFFLDVQVQHTASIWKQFSYLFFNSKLFYLFILFLFKYLIFVSLMVLACIFLTSGKLPSVLLSLAILILTPFTSLWSFLSLSSFMLDPDYTVLS